MTKLILLLTFLSVSAGVHAAEYGPFCQWHRDPCTTMAIQWIGTEEKQGTNGQWLVGSAGFGYGDDDDQTVL